MKAINTESIGYNIKEIDSLVSNAIVERADELMALKEKGEKLKFDHLYKLNIGNPLVLGQPVFSFNRLALAYAMFPEMLPSKSDSLNIDAKSRAQKLIKTQEFQFALGAYSESRGFKVVRESVKKFIEKRDGVSCDISNIYLSNGASDAILPLLQMIISCPKDGILIPMPQCPLYSVLIKLTIGKCIPYYLDEEKGWSIDFNDLNENYEKAVENGIKCKAMVVINPGNPTGQVLTQESMEAVIDFCSKKGLLLIADEVYQENIYTDKKKWVSFRKVLASKKGVNIELASLHSTSKGIMSECGFRGGYVELNNFDLFASSQFFKLRSIFGCSNTMGQLLTELMVNPPTLGVESKETVEIYTKQHDEFLNSLKERAKLLSTKLNEIKGIVSNEVEGAMYGFPRIMLTNSAIEAAKKKGMEPDLMYCLECLESTGIMIVPGSGFKQKPGTYHFRITNLIFDVKEFEKAMNILKKFTEEFFKKYP